MSILSYPDRGPWGRSSWPGNCSGHVVRELVERVRPQVFVDAMAGSGSAIEAARDAGVPHVIGLDLHAGFDCLTMPIAAQLPRPADLGFVHPPYHSMIAYSGRVWGTTPHPNDLSHANDDEDFHGKLQRVLMNLRDATAPGGTYACLIGDWRRNGLYTSYQSEVIARMPRGELAAVLIKQQHNCVSDARRYAPMRWPRIEHEYLIVWTRPQRIVSMLDTLGELARQHAELLRMTWRTIVHLCLVKLGGRAKLSALYDAVAQQASERVASAPAWREKVRQTLQLGKEFRAVSLQSTNDSDIYSSVYWYVLTKLYG